MAGITELVARAIGRPTEREAFLGRCIEALGLKPDDLIEAKNPETLKLAWDTALAESTREVTQRLASVEAAVKDAGFDLKTEEIGTLGDKIQARIKELASREALNITASRGIRPVDTARATAATAVGADLAGLKGRSKVAAAFDRDVKLRGSNGNH